MPAPRHHIHVGPTVFYRGGPRSQSEWEEGATRLVKEGQFFLAHDLAKSGLEQFPDSLKLKQALARALYRTGGIEEARKILEPLCPQFHADDPVLRSVYVALRKAVGTDRVDEQPTEETLGAVAQLLHEVGHAGDSLLRVPTADEETLGLLARVYKDLWKQSGNPEDARGSRDSYLRAFRLTRGYWTGINAATMSWLIGEKELARDLARQVLSVCEAAKPKAGSDDEYWIPATVGEALLLLGETEKAVQSYRKTAKRVNDRHENIVSSVQQLRLLSENGFAVPPQLFRILKPPTIVLFAGHRIDPPGRADPRFPPEKEAAVRSAIDEELRRLNARIGYSSATCGSDILFIEAMLDRDAEVNIVLPFDAEDFVKTSVAPAGESWVKRFRRALKQAKVVKYVTEEPYLGDEILFRFAGEVFQGYADLQARTLETTPYLLAVWDGNATGLVGGTADILSRWMDKKRLHVIRIDRLPIDGPAGRTLTRPVPGFASRSSRRVTSPYQRVIKTMLFADVVGYSKLEEEHTPFFMYQFLERIANHLQGVSEKPYFINTWGDAIFAVMDDATPLLEYVFALQRAVCDGEWDDLDLPEKLNVRIALHAGPVFEGQDPITSRGNFYGSHVNRAARIEPITVPGCVYASEQFTALLTTEQVAAQAEAKRRREVFESPFTWEYAGTLSLAKGFGTQAVYQIRRLHRLKETDALTAKPLKDGESPVASRRSLWH